MRASWAKLLALLAAMSRPRGPSEGRRAGAMAGPSQQHLAAPRKRDQVRGANRPREPLYNGPLSGYSAPSPTAGALPMTLMCHAAVPGGDSLPCEACGP